MATIFDPYINQALDLQQNFVQFAGENVWNLILYVIGISVYAIFIWHFYKYVARRDVFKWDTEKYQRAGAGGKFVQWFLYFVRYLVMYPILVFIWFGVFASLIFLLGDLEKINVLVTSFGLVVAIRVTAYYNEDISNDLGKMIPLAMLGVFILQPDFLNFSDFTDRLFELGLFAYDMLKFMLVAVVFEWLLRILWSIKRSVASPEDENSAKRFGHE